MYPYMPGSDLFRDSHAWIFLEAYHSSAESFVLLISGTKLGKLVELQ